MGKLIIIFFLLFQLLGANPYQENCLPCHAKLPVDIDKFFYRYLLEYSSEEAVKSALYDYLKQPSEGKTVMYGAFIARFGLKKPSTLSDKQLKEAIGIYWETYQVFGKLK